MALVLKDRVKQTATAPGTGTITLLTTPTGFQSFSAVGDGNTTYFAIVDPTSGAWEVNYGTYTSSGTTLSRNATPLSSSNAGSLVNFTGAVDVFLTYPSSRSVYLDAAGSAVTTLDIGTLGTSTANITTANITSGTVTTTPTSNTDIVNKQYADAIASGIHFHEAVALATTAALPANTYNNGTSGVGATLTANANGALSIDSTLTIAAERVLVKNEVAGANNGVYVVTQVGSAGTPYILTRATDFDSVGTGVDQIDEGDFFLVTSGVANLNTAWVQQTAPPITIGTTPIVFQQFSAPITYTAGTGLNESPAFTFNIANTTVTAATYGSASAVPVFAVNAQGQLTSVTDTAIAINGSAVTGNISGSAGSVANALTLGTYLTGTSFNGSAAVTATVDATSANTASKVVARDASGDFSAGTITATLSGASTSATTATNLAGGTANQIPFQASAGTTSFATAPSATGQFLGWNGSAFAWSVPSGSAATPTALGTVYGKVNNATPFLTALGYQAGNVVTGINNSFIGYQAGLVNTAGANNTALGFSALKSNGAFSFGSNLTAIGSNALQASTQGNSTAVGADALYSITTNGSSTAVGYHALRLDTGGQNTSVGYQAGKGITTGSQNVVIGRNAGFSGTNDLTTGQNVIIIGDSAAASAAGVNNEFTHGNSSITSNRFWGDFKMGGSSAGTSGQVLTSAGAGVSPTWSVGANLQEFSSSGTWTKPSGSTFVMVECWGAGGGGGSGRRGAAGTDRTGGAAGGGGSYTYRLFKASDLSATETVTIGAGSTGGAAVTVNSTNGNAATVAGDTSFGSVLFAYGGFGGAGGTAAAVAGGAGAGVLSAGLNTGANGGYPGSNAGQFGGDSGVANSAFGSGFGGGGGGGLSASTSYEGGSSYQGGAGGGAGGSITAGNALVASAAGGSIAGRRGGGGAAGATGAVGGNGVARNGGGGGGASTTAAAGAGGVGGFAAGGGGGGASLNGFNSGAGGNGGNGFCRVYTW